jgi:hypothetical protein
VRRRLYYPNEKHVVDRDTARNIRETFVDRPVERETKVTWRWPRSMQEVGHNLAVMYASDKWQRNRGDNRDYKHVSEGPQWVLARKGFLVEYDAPHKRLDVLGPTIELGPMPSSFAVLANILGIQVRLYDEEDEKGNYELPHDPTAGFYEITIAGAKLGGARFPDTHEPFLFVYTRDGVHLLIIGEQLDIEKDGIVGN